MGMIVNPYRFGAAVITDPYFANVSLLMHFDGTNGSTTFTDNSSNAHTLTANGNAQISTAQNKFGGASGLFDGNGDYVQTPSHASFGFGSGDFTVEGWFRATSANSNGFLADFTVSAGNSFFIWCSQSSHSAELGYSDEVGGGFVSSTTGFNTNTWVHWAITRASGTIRGFMDGVQKFTTTDSRTFASPQGVRIGSSSTANQGAIGNIDDVRVTKGVARYTSGFTPPTAPYPDS